MSKTNFKPTNVNRLERWLGKDVVSEISKNMDNWYGPPIALKGVPGAVYVDKTGNFSGEIRNGFEMSMWDQAEDMLRRLKRAARVASFRNRAQLNAGFANLSDLINESTVGGKRQALNYSKAGNAGLATFTNSLWWATGHPTAGGSAANAPGGTVHTSAIAGALVHQNPATVGDTNHIVSWASSATVASNSLLLYDRLFAVNKTMNSTAAEAVTGVPTRYQNTTLTAPDSIAGNFLIIECGTTPLSAGVHNWTPCTYLDQANAASTLPLVPGVSSVTANRLDHGNAGQWFAPLASGDVGIKALTNMQCSAAIATGNINFTIGHPLAWIVHPVANMITIIDGVNTAFNLERVFNDACLSMLEVNKPSATASTYSGIVNLVAG